MPSAAVAACVVSAAVPAEPLEPEAPQAVRASSRVRVRIRAMFLLSQFLIFDSFPLFCD